MPIRRAVRAVILHEDRLLLVNAWPDGISDLWGAPGGGAEPGTGLPANLVREVAEETGAAVDVGAPCLVNEFHDPATGWHQVDVFFRCRLLAPPQPGWRDPAGIVTRWAWFARGAFGAIRWKPDCLPAVAWGSEAAAYDPLEPITR